VTEALHATCVVVGEAGVLIRGPSGAGKSTLARRVLDEAARRGVFALMVSDDRVLVDRISDRAVARAHPAIAGALEVRGVGLLSGPHESAVVLRLVVDCGAVALDRMPHRDDLMAVVAGVSLPRVVAGPEQADRVFLALGRATYSFGAGEPETG
jgi:HPr kinase/phosphorylase